MPLATVHCRHARTGDKLSGTWHELQNGNISVMNSDIPIISTGADHACDQMNRMMKINSGLIVISNNANARQRLFLATPAMLRPSTEFKGQFQFAVTVHKPQEHHEVQPSAVKKQHNAVNKIKAAIYWIMEILLMQRVISFTTSWHMHMFLKKCATDSEYRWNWSETIWRLCCQTNQWRCQSWHRSSSRITPCSCQETRCKQPRSMTIGGSERNERSLWSSDGPSQIRSDCGSEECKWELWVYCDSQGTVCHRWIHPSMYGQVKAHTLPDKTGETQWNRSKWTSAIIWGSCWKRWWIRNITSSLWESRNCYCDWNDDRPTDGKEVRNNQQVKYFSQHFNNRLVTLTVDFYEVILVFDTYKTDSLKQKTTEKTTARQRSHSIPDCRRHKYQAHTNGHFLSHVKTKANLTDYLAEAVLKKNANSQKLIIITSAAGHKRSNRNMHFEDSNHEEADTLMVSLAAAASQQCPEARVVFFSPDTGVLVFAVAHCNKLCRNTAISMDSVILEIRPIWSVLGREKAAALHVFHAFTGQTMLGDFLDLAKRSGFNSTWRLMGKSYQQWWN